MNSIAMLSPASTHFLAAALKPILLIALLTEYLPFIPASYSVLDIGYTLAGRLPRIMDDYIKKVNFAGTKRAYFIGTCAQTPWMTVEYVKKLCKEQSFSLLGFNSVVMPQGYVAGGGTQPKEVNDKILKEAEPKIDKIAQAIRDKQMLPKEQPGKAVMSKVLNPIMYSMMISAKGFTATDQCTGCGKCEARCPLNNVKLVNGRPAWGKNCTHCMACIAGCPAEAIEYGKKRRADRVTISGMNETRSLR